MLYYSIALVEYNSELFHWGLLNIQEHSIGIYEYWSEKYYAVRFVSLLFQESIPRKYSLEMSGKAKRPGIRS